MTQRLRSLTLAVLLLPAGSAWSAAAFPLPPEKDPWIRVETAHFILFSNTAEERTTEIGLRLETLRQVLAQMLPELQVDSQQPLWVYVFKDDPSFAPYKRRSAVAPDRMSGSFAKHRDANFLAINAGRPLDPWRVLHHEYFHYFLSNNFTDIPLWFNEGAAECFSTIEIDEARVEIGRPPENHIHRLRQNPWIPFADLFRIDATSKEFNEVRGSVTFYAESWALTHYLLWEDAHGRSSGLRFLGAFPAGSRLDEGLESVLGTDRDGLESRVAQSLRKGRLRPTLTEMEDLRIDTSMRTTPMRRAEVLQRLGDLLARSDLGREQEAEAHFREAIRIDPDLATAYLGLGLVRDVQNRFDQAAGFFQKAIALDPGDAMARLYYGESLLKRDASSGPARRVVGGATPPGILLAREQFRNAIRLRPGWAEAYAGFGATYVPEVGPITEGIEALEKALALLPQQSDAVFNLAALHARNGDRDRARAVMQPLLSRSRDPEEIDRGRETLLQADYSRARTLLIQGDTEGSLALFKSVLTQTRDRALKHSLEMQIAEIEKTSEANRELDNYNQAVALANRGSYRKAAGLLDKLLREASDPDVIASARTLLKRVRQAAEETRPK
jgi:tetratricopeptide (TPR) repeat protein